LCVGNLVPEPASSLAIEDVFFLLSLHLAGATNGSLQGLPPAVLEVWRMAAQQGAVWGVA
jgi:hypothetical protein